MCSDFAAIARRLRGDCAVIAWQLRCAFAVMRGDCAAIPRQFRGDLEAI
jgi:hypothetical protein